MQFIGALLIGTVVLAYVCAFLERYGHLLLRLSGEVLLGALALAVLVLILRLIWSGFCRWWELRQIRVQTARAIQHTNQHFEASRAEMERLARAYHLRKGIRQ
jgi:hypothetical protein